jgi:hypothetical protein
MISNDAFLLLAVVALGRLALPAEAMQPVCQYDSIAAVNFVYSRHLDINMSKCAIETRNSYQALIEAVDRDCDNTTYLQLLHCGNCWLSMCSLSNMIDSNKFQCSDPYVRSVWACLSSHFVLNCNAPLPVCKSPAPTFPPAPPLLLLLLLAALLSLT